MTNTLGADHLRLDDIPKPAWVWDPDRARVVDANVAALGLWQEPSVADLMEREFDPEAAFALALGREPESADTKLSETILTLPLTDGMREMRCTITYRALKDGRGGALVVALAEVEASSSDATTRLAGAARNAPAALLTVDVDGRITVENDASRDMFGRGREALLAQRIGSTRITKALIEEALIHGRAGRTRTVPSRIGPRLARLTARRMEDPLTQRPSILIQIIDIEDQRAREAELQTHNEALADFLTASTDIYLELDHDLRLARISPRMAEQLGLDPYGAVGIHWRDLIASHGVSVSSEVDMAMGARSGWRELALSFNSDDAQSRFASSAQVLTSERGDFRGYRIVGREVVPPQEQAEVMSIETVAPTSTPSDFAEIVGASPWAVAIHRNFETLYINMAFTELFGLGENKIDAPGEIDVLSLMGESESALREDHNKLMSDDLSFAVRETDARHSDGRIITLQLRARKIDWRGEFAIEYVLEDVSAYRHDRRKSEERAAMMTSLLDKVPEAVLLMDGRGVVEWSNLAVLRLLGLPDGGPSPHDISDVLCPEDTGWAQDYIAGLAEGGLTRLFAEGRDVVVINANGDRMPALMALDRIDVGSHPRICAVLRDTSSWRKAEAELEEVRSEAASSSSQKSAFLARVGHELRTPLTAILGFAQVMARQELGPMGNARYVEYANDIQNSGDHLLSLINDLLDMSKVEAGKLDLNFGSVALKELTETCVRLMGPVAQGRQIELRAAVADGLPAVVADERSLKQILLNLISNALRFTEPHGHVTITAAVDELGGLTLSVKDTGVGMSEDELAVALEPFEQVEKAVANGTPGSGLGLPLARALTEANRAYFRINSVPQAGTTVDITFPSTQVLTE